MERWRLFPPTPLKPDHSVTAFTNSRMEGAFFFFWTDWQLLSWSLEAIHHVRRMNTLRPPCWENSKPREGAQVDEKPLGEGLPNVWVRKPPGKGVLRPQLPQLMHVDQSSTAQLRPFQTPDPQTCERNKIVALSH